MISISFLYAILAGLTLHAAWLTWLRPAVPLDHRVRALSYVALTVAFGYLALGRLGLLGIAHGEQPWISRGAFMLYGLCLVIKCGQHWWLAWQQRGDHVGHRHYHA